MLQYPFKHIFILGQRRFCQGDIISMTAEAAITTASMMPTREKTLLENLLYLYAPQVKQRVSMENTKTITYNQVMQSSFLAEMDLVYFFLLHKNEL